MLQTVAKTDPRPTRSATATPIDSPKTTSTSAPTSRTTTASDMKIESPYTFQKGLSSSTSYMTFIASITERNAPETPQRASAIEMIAPNVKALSAWLWVMLKELFLDKRRRRLRRHAREPIYHRLDEVVGVEDTEQRKQESEEREDREQGLVGEVAREGHDVVFVDLFVG